MAKQITFKVDKKEYILEFNRKTVKLASEKGLTAERLENIDNNKLDAVEVIPLLWSCAFDMHHPSVSEEERQELYDMMSNKQGKDDDLGLLGALSELFLEPITTLLEIEGNVEWTTSWR